LTNNRGGEQNSFAVEYHPMVKKR